jgi:hypothetical protein
MGSLHTRVDKSARCKAVRALQGVQKARPTQQESELGLVGVTV